MGDHPLYHLQIAAAVDGVISDRASATFGIRSVSSHLTPQGYRQFVINGKPVLIRGAGWASDMFLRDDPKRMETEFSYVREPRDSTPFAARASRRTHASTTLPIATAS